MCSVSVCNSFGIFQTIYMSHFELTITSEYLSEAYRANIKHNDIHSNNKEKKKRNCKMLNVEHSKRYKCGKNNVHSRQYGL